MEEVIEENKDCKELVVTGEILDDEATMDDVLKDADQKNSEHVAEDLKELGDAYESALRTIEMGKLSCKSVLERGKDIGITKGMIETYIAMKNATDLNKFAIMRAINEKQE